MVFERGKMVRGEGLKVLEERTKTMDPDKNEIYKFLGIEQADGIKTKKVFESVKGKVNKRDQHRIEWCECGVCNQHGSDTSSSLSNERLQNLLVENWRSWTK